MTAILGQILILILSSSRPSMLRINNQPKFRPQQLQQQLKFTMYLSKFQNFSQLHFYTVNVGW